MNNRFLLALKNTSFLSLFLAELLSQIAMNMMNFILILVAFSLTTSNTAVSGIVLSFTIPAIFFGILAGVYVDRKNKKKVLLGTNILRGVLLILLAFVHEKLLFVYAISFLIATITQFFIPAETPMIPILVKKEDLLSANALFGLALYGSLLIAYALSGPFLIFFGSTNALLALAILYFLGALCVALIRLPKVVQPMQKRKLILTKRGIVSEIKEAISDILKIREVSHAFFLLVLSQVLILIIAVIGPGYAKHVLHISINQFPLYFVTPAAVGMVIGAMVLTNYLHRVSKKKTATIGLFISAVAIFLLQYGSVLSSKAFIHTINVYLPHILQITIVHSMVVLAFILGIANALIFVPSNTTIQEQTSDAVRGKIYGTMNTIVALTSFLPIIAVGSIADIFGVPVVLSVIAIIVASIGAVRLFV